jgi:uncharacterized protein YhjY with autotransporter beta-barrel domain
MKILTLFIIISLGLFNNSLAKELNLPSTHTTAENKVLLNALDKYEEAENTLTQLKFKVLNAKDRVSELKMDLSMIQKIDNQKYIDKYEEAENTLTQLKFKVLNAKNRVSELKMDLSMIQKMN